MASRPKKPVKKVTKSKKPAAAKRETLVSLRAHIDEIETRLQHANKLTKSSVSALKRSFKKLNERVGGDAEQDGDLAKRLDQLSNHLTGLIDKTREERRP